MENSTGCRTPTPTRTVIRSASRTTIGLNYIRNSVKVVVDAYNGTTTFYVTDANEPIIKAYIGIFPALFKPIDQMPASLRAHIRYPERLFSVQAAMYSTYHMTDPQVFYNKEDLWAIPNDSSGDPVAGDGAVLCHHATAR